MRGAWRPPTPPLLIDATGTLIIKERCIVRSLPRRRAVLRPSLVFHVGAVLTLPAVFGDTAALGRARLAVPSLALAILPVAIGCGWFSDRAINRFGMLFAATPAKATRDEAVG